MTSDPYAKNHELPFLLIIFTFQVPVSLKVFPSEAPLVRLGLVGRTADLLFLLIYLPGASSRQVSSGGSTTGVLCLVRRTPDLLFY